MKVEDLFKLLKAGKFGLLSLPVLLMTSCSQPNAEFSGSEQITKEQRPESGESFGSVWRKFQKAARSKDVAGMSELIRFPIPNPMADLDESREVGSREDLGKCFNVLFPAEVVSMLGQTPSSKVNVENESGRSSWHFSYIHGDEVSEQEWAIFYTFERLPDGAVKLTKFDMAG
jgi:hypothetical protein